MPVSCKRVDGEWKVVDKDGKVHGSHGSDENKCKKQASAINANIKASEEAIVYISPPDSLDFVLAHGQDSLTFDKEVLHVGQFQKNGAKFEIEESTLVHMANSSNAMIANGIKVPLPIDHTTDPEKNRGNVTGFNVKKNSNGLPALFMRAKFRDKEAAQLAKTTSVSIYSPPEYTDGKGNRYVRPVKHVALTDYPVIPGLDNFKPISASFVEPEEKKEPEMALTKLAESLGLELSEDVKNDDEKISDLISLSFKDFKENNERLEGEVATLKKKTEKKEPIAVSSSMVKMFSENRELKLSDLAKDGHITEATRKELEKIFCKKETLELCLSEDTEDAFDEVVRALRENKAIEFGEKTGAQLGDDETPQMSVTARMAEKIYGKK